MNKDNIYQFDNIQDIKNFLFGGNATITLESKVTNNWFTYRIRRLKSGDEKSPLFVSVLTGNDNECSYTYMGTIFNNTNNSSFRLTDKSKMTTDALSYKAFLFFFDLLMMNDVHKDMNVYHQGVCGVCGRTITTASSLKTGIGPFCGKSNNNSKNKKSYVEFV